MRFFLWDPILLPLTAGWSSKFRSQKTARLLLPNSNARKLWSPSLVSFAAKYWTAFPGLATFAQSRSVIAALYSSFQTLAALGVGVDFVAPYLNRISDGGKQVTSSYRFIRHLGRKVLLIWLGLEGSLVLWQGFKEVIEMNDIVKTSKSGTRVLVASIRQASEVVALATQVGTHPPCHFCTQA